MDKIKTLYALNATDIETACFAKIYQIKFDPGDYIKTHFDIQCLIFSKGRYASHQYFPGSDGQTTRDWEANARLAHQPYILIVPAAQQQKSPEYQAFANHNVIETEYETFFNHVVIECTKKKMRQSK